MGEGTGGVEEVVEVGTGIVMIMRRKSLCQMVLYNRKTGPAPRKPLPQTWLLPLIAHDNHMLFKYYRL